MAETDFRLTADAVRAGITRMPTLPVWASALFSGLDGIEDVDQLVAKVSAEPAIVAKLLRLANSSFYGVSGKIASLHDAVLVIGTRAVLSLATSVALAREMGRALPPGRGLDYWRHSVASAIAARAIARHVRYDHEEAFVTGLLHDVGDLVLLAVFPAHYAEVMRVLAASDGLRLEVDRQVLGLDHGQIGGILARHWNFPERVCAAIEEHYEAVRQAPQMLVAIIHAADGLAHGLDLAEMPNEAVPPQLDDQWGVLGLSEESVGEILADVETQLSSLCAILVE